MIEIKLGSEKQTFDQAMAACIGYFDGFHLGHQSLFNKTLSIAKRNNQLSAIISFDPDPWVVIHKVPNANHLTTIEDRKRLAAALGFDVWISIQFDESMANMEPLLFLQKLWDLKIENLVCGFDFKFGKNGLGDVQFLKRNESDSFHVHEVSEYQVNHEKVSSTRIKIALKNGEMELVSQLLGRYYTLHGEVVGGRQIGRKIGYPTANLEVDPEYVLPKMGVYAGFVNIDGLQFGAMISIGLNPTVKSDKLVSIEAHIFDFDRDIYHKNVDFVFVHYLRPELKFANLDGLIKQLKLDELDSRVYLKNKRI